MVMNPAEFPMFGAGVGPTGGYPTFPAIPRFYQSPYNAAYLQQWYYNQYYRSDRWARGHMEYRVPCVPHYSVRVQDTPPTTLIGYRVLPPLYLVSPTTLMVLPKVCR